MKKAVLILLVVAFVFVFAAIVRAQEREPVVPVRPAQTAPPVEAVAPVVEKPAQPIPAVQAATPVPAAPVAAAAPTAAPQTAPTPAPKPTPALRTELIKLKYADIEAVTSILRAFQSNFGRVLPAGRAENTIVVSDTPEIIEKMLAVVRDIDVRPAEVQYTVQLVQGTDTDEAGDETLKNDPVIRELRGILRYKNFSLLDGTIMRVIDGETAEAKIGPKGEYAVRLRPKYTKEGAAETIQTEIQLGKLSWVSQQTTNTEKKEETRSVQSRFNELIRTTLLLKAGEKTVVGVSKSDSDRGLILILAGKVVK